MGNKDKIGDIVILDKNKEYIIINKYEDYVVLLSNFEPVSILVGRINDNKLSIETNQNTILKVLGNIKGEN